MSKRKSAPDLVINIVSAVWILLAAAVAALIFATNNGYSEPIFGDTMLVCVGENAPDGARSGSLAVVDLKGVGESEYYAAFTGTGVNITKDGMANVGTVSYFIPILGAAIDFLRTPTGFFLVVILPLAAMVVWHAVRIALAIKEERIRSAAAKAASEPTEAPPDDVDLSDKGKDKD